MNLCAAQMRSEPGDIGGNLRKHGALIAEAAASGARLVLFPELSLTGYEPRLALSLAVQIEDRRLSPLQQWSDHYGIIIGAGVPVSTTRLPLIGHLFFQPSAPRRLYAKTMLHPDEEPWFTPGTENVIIEAGGLRIAPAICFESLQTEHAARAAAEGADVYLAAVAKSAAGMAKAETHYPQIAARHGMAVLMANSLGPCDNFTAVGGSAAWDEEGTPAGQLSSSEEGLLFYERQGRPSS